MTVAMNIPGNAAVVDGSGQMSQAWRQFIGRLGNNSFQVGDYLQTARKPDGPWLLCDGSQVAQTDYPALYAVVKGTVGGGADPGSFNLPMIDPVYDVSHPAPNGPAVMQTWIKAL